LERSSRRVEKLALRLRATYFLWLKSTTNSPGPNPGTRSSRRAQDSTISTTTGTGRMGKRCPGKSQADIPPQESQEPLHVGWRESPRLHQTHLKNLQRGISVLSPDDIVSITLDQMRDEFRSSRNDDIGSTLKPVHSSSTNTR